MTKTKRLAHIYYDLATLFDAGIPVVRAFTILSRNKKGKDKKIFSDISDELFTGCSIHEAMQNHYRVFNQLDIKLVKAAEYSGNLPQCFKMLSKWYDFVGSINAKILSALILPIVIIHAAALVTAGFTFLNNGTNNTFFVKIISVLAPFYIGAAIILLIIYLRLRIRIIKNITDRFVLWIPLLGKAMWHTAIARYNKIFAMLFKAGVPIIKSTEMACSMTGNAVVSSIYEAAAENARQGKPVFQNLSRSLNAEYADLLSIAEETGQIDKAAEKVAEIASDRAELAFIDFARWFPRIIYGLVCLKLIVEIFSIATGITSTYSSFM